MLKVKPIPYVDESKNVYIIYIIDDWWIYRTVKI